jgi:hypothetical protein
MVTSWTSFDALFAFDRCTYTSRVDPWETVQGHPVHTIRQDWFHETRSSSAQRVQLLFIEQVSTCAVDSLRSLENGNCTSRVHQPCNLYRFRKFPRREKQLHRWESYHRNDSTALVCIRENEASCNEQQNNWVGRAENVGQDRRVPLNSPRDAACWIIVGNEPEPGSHRIDLDHLKVHK